MSLKYWEGNRGLVLGLVFGIVEVFAAGNRFVEAVDRVVGERTSFGMDSVVLDAAADSPAEGDQLASAEDSSHWVHWISKKGIR